MFGFLGGLSERKKAKAQIEEKIEDIQLNLENNYRKPAAEAYKAAQRSVEEYFAEGHINEKDYKEYKKWLSEYEKKLEGYL